MPLPPIEKVWQFAVNQSQVQQATAAQTIGEIFLKILASLKGFSARPWTVRGSSDSTTAGLDAVDRLVDYTKVVPNSAGAHSWIVLRQFGTGMEVCFDFDSLTVGGLTVVMSAAAGFTGGATTARPTATDESVLISQGGWIYGGTNNAAAKVHVLHSNDGQNTVVIVMHANQVTTFMLFGAASSPVPGWTYPYLAVVAGKGALSSTSLDTYTFLWSTANLKARGPSGNMSLYVTAESTPSPAATPICQNFNAADALSNEWWIQPLGLASTTTAMRGRHGRLFDFWMVASAIQSGDTFPADATRRYACFGDWCIPWNGSIPLTT